MKCSQCDAEQARDPAPDLLTVAEVVVVLRISRTKVYELASEWRTNDGDAGLHCAFVGGQIRFPRVAIEQIVGGPLTWPPVNVDHPADRPDRQLRSTASSPTAPSTGSTTGRMPSRTESRRLRPA